MPSQTRQVPGVPAVDFHQGLARGDDFDQSTVLQHQSVAAAQRGLVRQIEKKRQAVGAFHGETTSMPIMVIEHDMIGSPLRPRGRPLDRYGAHRGITHSQSKQEIALRERQDIDRRACQKFAVGADFVSLRINIDVGRGIVVNHAFL